MDTRPPLYSEGKESAPPSACTTAEMAAEFGLTSAEYAAMQGILKRPATLTELSIFAAMWSEHCSYKSSKRWLKELPTQGERVIQGPGENAGVVDIGDGLAAVFKIESHNHPSFIEPQQGAATGVGGILRDVFTMGARPIACLNALRFGAAEHPRTHSLLTGVVQGIGDYGNCFGVPTVGGEINFHAAYNNNCLVNVMAVGIAPTDQIFYARAAGIGYPVVYVGARTGRDGIQGAIMASAEFSEEAEAKRPTVQIGDPFTGKLLLEACLEVMALGAIVSIQDLGAAGLTCSSVEMADKGDLGIKLDLDKVPLRVPSMPAWEIMLSESQERMMMVLHPDQVEAAGAVFEKWGLVYAVVGTLTDDKRLRVYYQGQLEADIPVSPLVEAAPEYDRAWTLPVKPVFVKSKQMDTPDIANILRRLIGSPDLCSRRCVWEQYDSLVCGDTIFGPGAGDAAVVRVGAFGTETSYRDDPKGLALTTDCTPRYCAADPEQGGRQTVAEAWRNLNAVGAEPIALTNNLNFANPERSEIMGQLVFCLKGIIAASKALDFPVVSGNVSLYNETLCNGESHSILPTPVIGGLGLLADVSKRVGLALTQSGLDVILIGTTEGHMGASLYRYLMHGCQAGPPPPVDLKVERRQGDFVRAQIQDGLVAACHDLSDGGLAVALAEMVMSGTVSLDLDADLVPNHLEPVNWWFGEDQGRYLLAVIDGATILSRAAVAAIPAQLLGRTYSIKQDSILSDQKLTLSAEVELSVTQLRATWEEWLPHYMNTVPSCAD